MQPWRSRVIGRVLLQRTGIIGGAPELCMQGGADRPHLPEADARLAVSNRADLVWWRTFLPTWNGLIMLQLPSSFHVGRVCSILSMSVQHTLKECAAYRQWVCSILVWLLMHLDYGRDNALCGLDTASVIYVYVRSILVKSSITQGLRSVQQLHSL